MVQREMSKSKSKSKSKRQRRKHSAEYKAEVVRLCRDSDKSPETIGAEMGLAGSLVRSWVNQSRVDAAGGGKGALTTSERDELTELRKEVRHLRQERDILKKATVFFVKEATS
jgi:transposase